MCNMKFRDLHVIPQNHTGAEAGGGECVEEGWDTHLCEAKEESDTSKDLQSLSCMVQHHVPAGETGTCLFA